MGFDSYGPTQRPNPPKPVTDTSDLAAQAANQRRDDRAFSPDGATLAALTGNAYKEVKVTGSSDPILIDAASLSAGIWLIQGKVEAVGATTLTAQLTDDYGNALGPEFTSTTGRITVPAQVWKSSPPASPGVRLTFAYTGYPDPVEGTLTATRLIDLS